MKINRGFTLIELLVVIAVMSLIASLATPAFRAMTNVSNASGVSFQIVQEVNHARQIAKTTGYDTYLIFPNTTNTPLYDINHHRLVIGNSFAIISHGKPSDQPGNHPWYMVSDWMSIPSDFQVHPLKLTTNNFIVLSTWQADYGKAPIPSFGLVTNNNTVFPAIGFNYQGRTISGISEYIPIVKFSQHDPNAIDSKYTNSAYAVIAVDGVTGLTTIQDRKIH